MIIEMEARHVQQVADLEKECFSSPWSAASIASELQNPLSYWLVAELNGEVVGYVGSQTVLGESDMMNIGVSKALRRHGIAQRLVEALVQALKDRGAYQITLEVRSSNDAARALYSKLGFYEIGRRPNYYTNPKEDALILRKEWKL